MVELSADVRRVLQAPPALVWALVADTNRFDRAAGLMAGRYEWAELQPGNPRSRARVASARELGLFDLRWVEPPYEWIEGRFVRGKRDFLQGPVRAGGFRVELRPEGEGTRVEATGWVRAEGLFGNVAARVQQARFRSALPAYVDSIASVLAPERLAAAKFRPREEPPAAAARRLLLAGKTDETTSGRFSPVSEADLAHRARRFAETGVSDALREKLLELVRTRPDEELSQLRPFELARAWGLDRREVLRAFLHASRSGLLDLRWQLNCPTCRVGADNADSLARVGRKAHCAACNVDFDLDFAQHIEAVFSVNRAVRPVEVEVYCASSPWFRPHVYAQLTLEPGEALEVPEVELPEGPMLFRVLQGAGRGTFDGDLPARLGCTLREDGLALEPSGKAEGGRTHFALRNEGSRPATLLLERAGWNAEVVLGSVLATMPEFLDLFATEAPASGVDLSVGALTILFTDLTGSTAMYERLGDARAFAIVQEHFDQMLAAIAKHGGAVLKTMGDAVMASFETPTAALRASLEMIEETERAHGPLGVSVKLGFHEGPCLAVRANDKLDFFGTTVNVAARLQAQAHGSEVVVMKSLLSHADVAALVAERRLHARPFTASLKGIKEEQTLVALSREGTEAKDA